jgi:hypothetical protein
MATLTELRRQVRHTLMAMAGLEQPEPVLHGHCVLLAAMVMAPSGVLARTSSTDPAFVARSDPDPGTRGAPLCRGARAPGGGLSPGAGGGPD